MIQAKHKKECY